MIEAISSLFDWLLVPAGWVLDPAKRIYWGGLFAALIIASLTVVAAEGRFNLREQLKSLCNPNYWFNRSTATDFALLLVGALVGMLLLAPFLGSHLGATIVVGGFLQEHLGNAPVLDLPWYLIASLFTVAFFVAEDLSRFVLHLSMHRIPALWRFHRVHHSATTLTPLTLYRVHPVEQGLYYLRGLAVFGLVSGVFVWCFQSRLTSWQILGVDALGFMFNIAGANLRHSHIFLSFGPFERWFVSPAQHQLHHSTAHSHANLGSWLACWDRLNGSWLPATKDTPPLQFGLRRAS